MATYDIHADLTAYTAMVNNLVPYIYEKELFGQIGNRLPRLTLGGMLMRQHRLQTLRHELKPEEVLAFDEAITKLKDLRYEWLNHYKDKLLQEFNSRVNAMGFFIEECDADWSTCDANWPNEAEKRTIIAHVVEEATAQKIYETEQRNKLNKLDQKLRRFFREDNFLWDDRLQDAYPKQAFWWLYGRPGRNDNRE